MEPKCDSFQLLGEDNSIAGKAFNAANKMKKNNTGQIRIISGKWRGRKLPVADSQGLRPTTDRTKETLFNWLMPYLHQDMRCLDLFAGSGGLAIEALSRGVAQVTMVEKEKHLVKKLQDIPAMLGVNAQDMKIVHQDAITFLENSGHNQPFDLVFLDPPFGLGLLDKAVSALLKNNWLAKDAIIYVEYEVGLSWALPTELRELKSKSTKQVCSRLLTL